MHVDPYLARKRILRLKVNAYFIQHLELVCRALSVLATVNATYPMKTVQMLSTVEFELPKGAKIGSLLQVTLQFLLRL